MNKMDREKIIAPEHPMRADAYPLSEYAAIGKRVRRKDGYEKASGYAIYTSDVQLPGMLYLEDPRLSLPACAHQETWIQTKAEALPGVRAVLRFDDPELPEKADMTGHMGGAGEAPEPVLNRVGYWQGMPMGVAVAADTEDIANEAIEAGGDRVGGAAFQPRHGRGAQARRASYQARNRTPRATSVSPVFGTRRR